jgi:glycosyltransferase involved in cell wall biosynthesis
MKMDSRDQIGASEPRICLIAHYAYGSLLQSNTGHIGGIEWQTSMMARWFAAHGYRVSMITWNEGQEDRVEIDGVRVFKMCRQDEGIPGLRFFWPRWTALNAAMMRADADVYYYNCGDLGLGQVVMWARRNDRRCMYSVASDPNCDIRLPLLKPLRERFLYRYGLRHVDRVIVQTERQRQMLRKGFGVDSIVIPMPCEEFPSRDPHGPERDGEHPTRVLWVGRVSREKRLEWFLDVAERCPEMHFDIVGACNTDSDYASVLTQRAAAISNVEMHGKVPHGEMTEYYQRCRVLCCTSAYEGFPNTFLEAWSLGVPIVSTFDPDGVISRHKLGWTAATVDELANVLRGLAADSRRWRMAAESAREYYLQNHTLDSCMGQFARIVGDLCSE